MMMACLHYLLNFQPDDIIMTPTPLYHSSGGLLSAAQCICFGNSQVILKKFSASKFWDQCVKYKATVKNDKKIYNVKN